MPQNQVGLDAPLLQIDNSLFKVLPKLGIGSIEIKTTVGKFLESESFRLVLVVRVAFREDTEANLVER